MKSDYYCLDENKNAVPCDALTWSIQREEMRKRNTKHVGSDTINGRWVSTVWLGLNHNYFEDGPPHIFETMIRDEVKGEWLDYCERYSTWQEAEQGHRRTIELIKIFTGLGKPDE